jgi:hypothetical protein
VEFVESDGLKIAYEPVGGTPSTIAEALASVVAGAEEMAPRRSPIGSTKSKGHHGT